MQNLVTVSRSVRACRGSREISATLIPPVKEEAWLPPRNTPILHLSYHAEFGQTVGGRQGGPEIFGSDGPRPYLTP